MKSTDSPAAMRCKPGDIAVIVSAPLSGLDILIGAHLQCVDLCDLAKRLLDEPVWHIIPMSPCLSNGLFTHLPDSCLRPLRDGPGRDESLEWAPVPKTRTGVKA